MNGDLFINLKLRIQIKNIVNKFTTAYNKDLIITTR